MSDHITASRSVGLSGHDLPDLEQRPWRRPKDPGSPLRDLPAVRPWRRKVAQDMSAPTPVVPTSQGAICFQSYTLSTSMSKLVSGCMNPAITRTLAPSYARMLTMSGKRAIGDVEEVATTGCTCPPPHLGFPVHRRGPSPSLTRHERKAAEANAISLHEVDVDISRRSPEVVDGWPRIGSRNTNQAAILALLRDLNKPHGGWSSKAWTQVRDMIMQDGRTHLYRNLVQSVQRSTREALEQQSYMHDSGKVALLCSDVARVQWFGCLNAGVAPSLDDETQKAGKIAPPLLVCEASPLDIAVKLRQCRGTAAPVVLVLELTCFDKYGNLDLTNASAVSPRCMPLRSDFATFARAAEAKLRAGPATMRDHLCAARDPYVFLCPNVTIFRGSREDGYPFLKDTICTHAIGTAVCTPRPNVQLVSSNSNQMEWYYDESDHTALLERLNLIGVVALKEAHKHMGSRADCKIEKGGRPSESYPSLVLGVPGCTEGGANHPRDAIANSLKHWRRSFGPYFRSVFICCGGSGDPNLAPYLDVVINRQVYKMAESRALAVKMCPWHWDPREIGMSVEPGKLEHAGRMCIREDVNGSVVPRCQPEQFQAIATNSIAQLNTRKEGHVNWKGTRQSICTELSQSLQQASLAVRGCTPLDSDGGSSNESQSAAEENDCKTDEVAQDLVRPSADQPLSSLNSQRASVSIPRRQSGHPTLLTSLADLKNDRRQSKSAAKAESETRTSRSPKPTKSPSAAKKQAGFKRTPTAPLEDIEAGAQTKQNTVEGLFNTLQAQQPSLVSPTSQASTDCPASLQESLSPAAMFTESKQSESHKRDIPVQCSAKPRRSSFLNVVRSMRSGGRRKSTGGMCERGLSPSQSWQTCSPSPRRDQGEADTKEEAGQCADGQDAAPSKPIARARRRSCELHTRSSAQTYQDQATLEDKLVELMLEIPNRQGEPRRYSGSSEHISPRNRRPSIENMVGDSGVVMMQRQAADKTPTSPRTPKTPKKKMRSNKDVEATASELEIRRLVRERLRTRRNSHELQNARPASTISSFGLDSSRGDSPEGNISVAATTHSSPRASSPQLDRLVRIDEALSPGSARSGHQRKSHTLKTHMLAIRKRTKESMQESARESLYGEALHHHVDINLLRRIDEGTEMSEKDPLCAAGDDDEAGSFFIPRFRPVTKKEQITSGRRTSAFQALGARNFHF